jgi:hypothetical protein
MPNLNKNVSIDWIMSVEMFLDAYTASQLLSNWWEENTEIEYGRLFFEIIFVQRK